MRELILTDATPEAFGDAIGNLIGNQGIRNFSLSCADPELAALFESRIVASGGVLADTVDTVDKPMAHLIWASKGDELTELFGRYIDRDETLIVAPKTDRFFKNSCVFPISPPKAGTHVLITLLEAFGFLPGHSCPTFPKPRHWHYLEFTNAHTKATDFFVDTMRRSLHGNRDHPFGKYPTLLIYRNPLDILVSESRYYHLDGRTLFAGYLSGLTQEERLLRLADDPWLLGSIMDRLAGYVAWLDFPSVIPVSFEELVGSQGGGCDKAQEDAIWSLQLKLHVPGKPSDFSRKVFDPASPTFYRGRIGSHQEVFSERVWTKIRALPQEVMQAFGYIEGQRLPMNTEKFRRRLPNFSKESFADTELMVQADFFGFNLVKIGDRFLAKPARAHYEKHEVLDSTDPEMLRHIVARQALHKL